VVVVYPSPYSVLYFPLHRPCHTIPGGPASQKIIETTDAHHPRIESAFRKYFYRAPAPEDGEESPDKHEFEIYVCHANVIRYWMCRYVPLNLALLDLASLFGL